ncbi:MAG TPA: molybdopterin-dependent oxidoreductase, partial [Burkholderiales bacterium]|nr:molybdopterin-dependent oxidoreductase [Burkholderiales bacterium]
MTTTTRGFTGRRRARPEGNRVPPGQFVTDDFPVLSAGPTPRTPLEKWTLALQDGGSLAGRWTWEEFQSLPQTEITVDIHCVTKWSKLGTRWQGVTIDHLIEAAGL